MKLLEDNIGENLDDLGNGNDILDVTSKAQFMKEINDKLGFMKMKNCYAKKQKHTKKQTLRV